MTPLEVAILEMEAFDKLPKVMREFISEFPHPLPATKLLMYVNMYGTSTVMTQLQQQFNVRISTAQ